MVDYARRAVLKYKGPFATVYGCPFCKHHDTVQKSRPGMGVGRGYGLRTGGSAHSKMGAHIRAEHPEELKAWIVREQSRKVKR